MIPYGRQDVTQTDIDSVIDVLRSDFLTQGPAVPRFEEALAAYTGAQFALAVNSATSALHLACLALGLGPGDVLWTTPVTFVASSNCALYCGAQVDFVDIDPRTYNVSPAELKRKLEKAERDNQLPKILVLVHLTGQPCALAEFQELGQRYGFKIIEDASHAIGGKYRGKPIGDCRYSDVTIFSFHPVKIITTGEGGAALTNSRQLADKMALLRSHGITRDPGLMNREPHGSWYYQQVALGFNYRLTDIQAAMGLSQLERLDDYVKARHDLARRYDVLLTGLPVLTPWQHPDSYSAFHLYVIRLRLEEIHRTHREVFEGLRSRRIGVNLHYIPIHTQPFYVNMGFKEGMFPEAERYYAEAITLPLYPRLTEAEQDEVVAALSAELTG